MWRIIKGAVIENSEVCSTMFAAKAYRSKEVTGVANRFGTFWPFCLTWATFLRKMSDPTV